ncbi:MAG: transporter family protein [Devosia sp.]|uniref:ABC transporter ATP-binding protein n=1 Tax=Devosia sp. TaxID=1871048 RepID=UPI002628485D|nr:ABC transporter ATP-binding protein [Devosia sp.]MDB5585926.1 transporter family protein [Devosia sp.]
MSTASKAFEARGVSKLYGETAVLKDIDLSIERGEFVVLLGPSGCGKSTLMRCIAGLEKTNSGQLLIDGRDVTTVAPAARDVAMVFQSYALFPHMNVADNIGFGMRIAHTPKAEMSARVLAAAKLLKIEHLLDRKPRALSGGQRQRVAIGRAIVRNPKIFLFDEPLSNLDAALRLETRVELTKLHHRIGNTMIYVTHDQVEAMTMADKIVVMREGRIEQIGSPLELYNNPKNLFVATFLGQPPTNVVETTVVESSAAGLTVAVGEDRLTLPATGAVLTPGQTVRIGLRPESFSIGQGRGALTVLVDLVEQLGNETLVHCQLANGQTLTLKLPGQINPPAGSSLALDVARDQTMIFDGDGNNLRYDGRAE